MKWRPCTWSFSALLRLDGSMVGKISDEDYVTFYSGGNKHQYGVGIMMRKSIASCVTRYWPISDRLIMLKLGGAPFNVNIIQAYAPTSDQSDEEVEEFQGSIQNVMKHTKSGEINIVMEDWSAKVGNQHEYSVTGGFGLGERNERGEKWVNFCFSFKFAIANTFFQQPKRSKYTWRSPGDIHRSQIDYILISQRFRHCVKQTKVYPSAGIGSDHNQVVMKFLVN